MKGRILFSKFRVFLVVLSRIIFILPKFFQYFIYRRIVNIQGRTGIALRYVLIKAIAKRIGDNVSIHPFCVLKNIHKMEIGDNVSIHSFSYLDAAGGLTIGDNVSIAHNSSILTTNHTWLNKLEPIKYNPTSASEVCIKSDVWIGCGVKIMPGVIINSRSIIAAGAVVTKSVDRNIITGGVPAKKIKSI